MKAYLVKKAELLWPYRKPGSAFVYKEGTVKEKLVSQLKKNGFSIEYIDTEEPFTVDKKSIVLSDDLMISDSFLSVLKKSIPSKKSCYQFEVDVSLYPTLTPKGKAERFKSLPISYFGKSGKNNESNFKKISLKPSVVYEMSEGLPPKMHELENVKAHFLDFYAIQLEHWFDVQTATNVYCRELVSKLASSASMALPGKLSDKVMGWQWLSQKTNIIGKNCRIHPTAILEGCIVGNNVEIGPFAYLRASVIDDNAILRERTSVKVSYIGKDTYIVGTDVVNSYVGIGSSLVSPMLFHVVFGERSFLSGGSGFADFNTGSSTISAKLEDKEIDSELHYLATGVGDDVFIGANMIFAPGRAIPDGSNYLDHGLLKNLPQEGEGSYVLSGSKFIQIPTSFFGDK